MKNEEKLVSIIVPIFKVEEYLNRCIISLVHQTYTNIEIILVDDGSPDNSGVMCDSWAKKDTRIKVIHKKNGGLSSARNEGLKIAKGDYIAFIDSDDWVSINFIEDMITAGEKYNGDIIICRFADVLPDGRIEVDCKTPTKIKCLSKKEFCEKILKDREISNHVWRKLYKRNILKEDIFPVGKNFEDIFVMPIVSEQIKKAVQIPNIDYFYRQNINGIVNDASVKNYENYLEARIYATNKFSKIEPSLKSLAETQQGLKDWELLRDIDNSHLSTKNKEILENKVKVDLNKRTIDFSSTESPKLLKLKSIFDHYAYQSEQLKNLRQYIKKYAKKGKSKIITLKDLNNLKKKIEKLRNKPIFWILSTPQHGNLGDQALKWGEIEFIKKYFPDYNIMLVPLDELHFISTIRKYITTEDIVALHAGGNIGTLYPGIHESQLKALDLLKDKKIIIFPQTFYFSNDAKGREEIQKTYSILESIDKLHIFVRDKQSLNLIKQKMPKLNVSWAPDMALFLRFNKKFKRHGAITLLRQDSEKTLTDKENDYILSVLENEFSQITASDMHLYYDGLSEEESRVKVREQLSKLSQAELVVTDRLHGMLFCAITQTPCVVVKSKSYKIQGVYEWIKQNPYIQLIDNLEDLPKAINKLKTIKNNQFNMANIDKQFKEMETIIKDYKL